MAISIILGFICITQNIEAIYIVLRNHLDINLYKSIGNIFKDISIYLLLIEAVILVVVTV